MINRPHPLAEYIPHPRGRRNKKALKTEVNTSVFYYLIFPLLLGEGQGEVI